MVYCDSCSAAFSDRLMDRTKNLAMAIPSVNLFNILRHQFSKTWRIYGVNPRDSFNPSGRAWGQKIENDEQQELIMGSWGIVGDSNVNLNYEWDKMVPTGQERSNLTACRPAQLPNLHAYWGTRKAVLQD